MRVEAIRWKGERLELLDQRHLPHEVSYLSLTDVSGVADAIRLMVVRGAPAIAVAAAFGVVLAARRAHLRGKSVSGAVKEALALLQETRPTAVNLRHALEHMHRVMELGLSLPVDLQVAQLEAEAIAMQSFDLAVNREIGARGAPLLERCTGVLTHCNTGALATSGFGTALGVLRQAIHDGARFRVYVDETRPYLQGARLTAWELVTEDIPTTLLVDSAAAVLMQRREIQAVIVGADRIAANGDVANKIGTYGLAMLARAHDIPFYVAAPSSTLDPTVEVGDAIPIEQREAKEITHWQDKRIAPEGVAVFNPAFDVTPARCVSAIITEVGILTPPFDGQILRAWKQGDELRARSSVKAASRLA